MYSFPNLEPAVGSYLVLFFFFFSEVKQIYLEGYNKNLSKTFSLI